MTKEIENKVGNHQDGVSRETGLWNGESLDMSTLLLKKDARREDVNLFRKHLLEKKSHSDGATETCSAACMCPHCMKGAVPFSPEDDSLSHSDASKLSKDSSLTVKSPLISENEADILLLHVRDCDLFPMDEIDVDPLENPSEIDLLILREMFKFYEIDNERILNTLADIIIKHISTGAKKSDEEFLQQLGLSDGTIAVILLLSTMPMFLAALPSAETSPVMIHEIIKRITDQVLLNEATLNNDQEVHLLLKDCILDGVAVRISREEGGLRIIFVTPGVKMTDIVLFHQETLKSGLQQRLAVDRVDIYVQELRTDEDGDGFEESDNGMAGNDGQSKGNDGYFLQEDAEEGR
jgi:hypothetical protein